MGVKNRLPSCSCPLLDDGRPACKGDNPDDEDRYDPTPPNYLFLGPRGGHPRVAQVGRTAQRAVLLALRSRVFGCVRRAR